MLRCGDTAGGGEAVAGRGSGAPAKGAGRGLRRGLRSDGAVASGVGLQTFREWVMRFNADRRRG
jgi:hypothetical protein